MTLVEHQSVLRRRPFSLRAKIGAVAVVVVALVVGALVWSAPRDDVPAPGPEATPEQVVRAYLDAVRARDFETANAIDRSPTDDLGRFSRPLTATEVEFGEASVSGDRVHVLFTADFEGGDGTVSDGWWGYYLEKDAEGAWHIVDSGVA